MRHPDEPFLVAPDPKPPTFATSKIRPGTKEWLAYLRRVNAAPVEKEGEIERITFGDPAKMRKP